MSEPREPVTIDAGVSPGTAVLPQNVVNLRPHQPGVTPNPNPNVEMVKRTHAEKVEMFCQVFVKLGDKSAAYRACGLADGKTQKQIWRGAFELSKRPKVAKRIEELQRAMRQATEVTLEMHVRDLLILRNDAKKVGNYGAAIQAEIARGRVCGLYVERHLHVGVLAKLDLNMLSERELEDLANGELSDDLVARISSAA